jgi:patatin-like phospholipase/acyl hydrolase
MGNKYTRILSIDGGGIRGVFPGQIIVTLEKKLQERTKNPDARIADFFDIIAGTSTGGILACAYLKPAEDGSGRPQYTAEEVVGLYFKKGASIFATSTWDKIKNPGGIFDEKYPSEGMDDALREYFGDVKLSSLLLPTLITSYDIKRRKGHFFRSHRAKLEDSYDYLVREVARSTSAAPTYFECELATSISGVKYPLIDGGVFVNNPGLCAYSEVREHMKSEGSKVTAKHMVMLSVGTGFNHEPYEYEKAKDYGAAQWIKPLIDIMMSGVADTVDFQLGQLFDAADVPDQYIRVNAKIPSDVNSAMDDASPENMQALKEFGIEEAESHSDDLDRLIDYLLADDGHGEEGIDGDHITAV